MKFTKCHIIYIKYTFFYISQISIVTKILNYVIDIQRGFLFTTSLGHIIVVIVVGFSAHKLQYKFKIVWDLPGVLSKKFKIQ